MPKNKPELLDEEEVVLNIDDEELVNDILMNLEILKVRGQAQELNNNPSDIVDLLFEGSKDGGDVKPPLSARKRRKNHGRKRANGGNRKQRQKNKKKRRRIRLNGPSFGDKVKDVIIYY